MLLNTSIRTKAHARAPEHLCENLARFGPRFGGGPFAPSSLRRAHPSGQIPRGRFGRRGDAAAGSRCHGAADRCVSMLQRQRSGPAQAPPPSASYKIVLPTAATQPVTLNGGMPMPAWFDVYGLDKSAESDEAGILAAVARLDRLAAQEDPSTTIVYGGFSQGGAIALTAGLRSSIQNVGAVVGASTWLPLGETYPAALADGALARPVSLHHGEADEARRGADEPGRGAAVAGERWGFAAPPRPRATWVRGAVAVVRGGAAAARDGVGTAAAARLPTAGRPHDVGPGVAREAQGIGRRRRDDDVSGHGPLGMRRRIRRGVVVSGARRRGDE